MASGHLSACCCVPCTMHLSSPMHDPIKSDKLSVEHALTHLYQELIPPVVQVVKGLGIVHVIHKHAAVRSSIKSDT